MASLEWSPALALDMACMDDTHREFVDLLAAVDAADDAAVPAPWQALIDHTVEHFGQEDRWMQATGFGSANCHSLQHKVVLEVMREGAASGQPAVIRQMARELGGWFVAHAQSMDAALALHLRSAGFDPADALSPPEPETAW